MARGDEERARAERTARAGGLALLVSTVLFLAVLVWAWIVLPADGVAHRMGPGGPSRFGSRAGLLVPLLLLGPVLLLGLRWLIAALLRSDSGVAMINYPHKDYWTAPGRIRAFRRRAVGEIDLFWAATLLLITVGILEAVRFTDDPGARSLMLPALGGYLAFTAWWVWWLLSRSRPPKED